MAEFTSWLVDYDDLEGMEHNIHILDATDTNQRICFMSIGPDTEKHAHLIAASPDLYAALSDACEILEVLSNPNEQNNVQISLQVLWSRCVHTSRKGFSALSKARGDV